VSRKGDYNKNMNSKMFLKWVNEKVLPTFARLYPGKNLLIMDNALYHHKRDIGALSNKAKKELIETMKDNNIPHILTYHGTTKA
jgi:hypothetical protein